MSGKYLIFGATGSIGSNLSKMMAENNEDVQLIGRDEESLKNISSEKIIESGLHEFIDNLQIKINDINLDIFQTFCDPRHY